MTTTHPSWLARSRKFAAAALGALALIVSTGVLHGQAETIANVVLAAATALGVYVVPNAKPTPASATPAAPAPPPAQPSAF